MTVPYPAALTWLGDLPPLLALSFSSLISISAMLDLFVSHFRESSQDCSEVIQKEQFQMRLLKPYTQECSRHIYNLSKIIIIVSKEMATFVAAWYVG